MPSQRSSNVFQVEVAGSELSDVVQGVLVEVTIEDELNLPDACELVFRDPLRTVVPDGRFELGAELTVSVVSEANPEGATIFAGEITGLEAEIERDGTLTIVRGLDLLHRLQRGTHTETYLDVTYGDLLGTVAGRHDLDVGDTGTNSVVHEAVTQWNETDWEFVSRLAARIGHEVVVVEGRLEMREPPTNDDAPGDADVGSEDSHQLVLGGNLLQMRSTISGGEQVRSVTVRGWDPTAKEAVESSHDATRAAGSAAAGLGSADISSALAGGTLVLAAPPIRSAEIAGAEAERVAQQLGSAAAELEGVAYGNPDLRAGCAVTVVGLGEPFDGDFVLTSCRHEFEPVGGYRTAFRVSGRQNRTMLGVITGSHHGSSRATPLGVVPALVSDVDDPDGIGRVKVTFPWLADAATSHWARVALPGAGPERGLAVLPEVDDEVLVGFEHGNPDHPVVLGGLWNGQDAPPVEVVDGGEVVTRALVTRTGHRIELHDRDETVSIVTGDDQHRLVLDASGQKIVIESSGDVEITSQKTVAVSSPQGMSFTSDGALELTGMGVTIDAGAGSFEAKGTSLTLSGSADATLDGGASTTVKGGIVRIN